jgi:hypothetical protein
MKLKAFPSPGIFFIATVWGRFNCIDLFPKFLVRQGLSNITMYWRDNNLPTVQAGTKNARKVNDKPMMIFLKM